MAQVSLDLPADKDSNATKVLVVEDEILIRLTVADYLRDCGFHVLEAANADEAVRILTADIPVDIVFSDVQMPGTMDGFGLARWLRAHRPQVRIILTSGLARTSSLAGELCEELPLVPKPFEPESLLLRLREALGKNHPQDNDLRNRGP